MFNYFRIVIFIGIQILFLSLFFAQDAVAQLKDVGIPFRHAIDFETEEMHLSLRKEQADQMKLPDNTPPLIGITSQVEIDPSTNGTWILFPESGLKVWRMVINVENSSNLSFYFKHFEPGEKGKFFVISADRKKILGAYTQISRVEGHPFSIEPLESERVILHFETDIESSDYDFLISEIGLLFSDKSVSGYGTSGSCQVNVNCTEGAEWQRQKRGVARILVKQGSGLFYCTGSLINNARNDETPYFLTANHCGELSSAADYAQWIFAFNYETTSCNNPLAEPVAQTLTGANLISKATNGTSEGSDFKLLRLLQDVPKTYNPFFNGWSRQNNVTTSGTSIHHPDGDVKKISTFTARPVSSGYGFGGSNPDEKYWRVNWSQTENGFGVTEGGSSGSPLFDSNGRIVGMLTGGISSCSNTSGADYYGKVSYAWESNGTVSALQLKPWLDPDNSGIQVLGGLGSDTLFVLADFDAKRKEISINQKVDFENLSSGKIETYSWFFEGGNPDKSSEMKPPAIFYEQFGTFDVRLIVSNSSTADTLLKEKFISVKPFLFPNPAENVFELSFGIDLTPDTEIEIYDAQGRIVSFEAFIDGSRLRVVLHHPTRGAYVVRVLDKFVDKNLKLIIAR
ncbi:MAG: T9SS type A sorting domain-containing protein [Bacteroidales bacterium]|nr:T9SS type A sorting domain-containing protein [Bacteroidales bacterium]